MFSFKNVLPVKTSTCWLFCPHSHSRTVINHSLRVAGLISEHVAAETPKMVLMHQDNKDASTSSTFAAWKTVARHWSFFFFFFTSKLYIFLKIIYNSCTSGLCKCWTQQLIWYILVAKCFVSYVHLPIFSIKKMQTWTVRLRFCMNVFFSLLFRTV